MKSGKPKKAPKVSIQKGPSRNFMREADQVKKGVLKGTGSRIKKR